MPIKSTPVLRGQDALRFLKQVEENEKKDHSDSFRRAKAVYDEWKKNKGFSALFD